MFTVPVGNFNRSTTFKRPTSSSSTVTGDGFATNASSAYDTSSSTYASIGCVSLGTFEVVYSLFPVATLLTGVTVNILVEASGIHIGGNYESGMAILLSIDGGVTYPYTFTFNGGYIESEQIGPGLYINMINASTSILPISIVTPISAEDIKIKVTGSMNGTIKLYDIYYEI